MESRLDRIHRSSDAQDTTEEMEAWRRKQEADNQAASRMTKQSKIGSELGHTALAVPLFIETPAPEPD
jgi:hypothetical protein